MSDLISGTYTITQLASLFQVSEAAMRGKLKALTTDHAFPPPLPVIGGRWSRAAVDQWVADCGMEAEIGMESTNPITLAVQ